jgi:hypothetical protein
VRIFYFSLPDEHRIPCRHPILQGKKVQRTFPEMDIGNHKIAPVGGPIVEPLKFGDSNSLFCAPRGLVHLVRLLTLGRDYKNANGYAWSRS